MWMLANVKEGLCLLLAVAAVVTRRPRTVAFYLLNSCFIPRIHISSPIRSLPRTTAMAQRVTLRKRQPYNTTSSRRRIVKTPGGVLRYHHIKKLPTAPKCGDCGSKLSGVRNPLAVPYFRAYHRSTGEIGCCPSPTSICNGVQNEKACQPGIWGFAMRWLRAFAVRSNSYDCLCRVHLTYNQYNSIVRAFLIEEAKVVKRVIKSQQKAGGRS
jgi:large subunit ribosomal protein L34e